ncbi:hypothetical protein AB1N83_011137 [Pleurotus pulmonarius]
MASIRTILPYIVAFILIAACSVAAQSPCDCTHGTTGNRYSQTDVTKAFNLAKKLRLNTVGKKGARKREKYPHYFGNGEGLAFPAGCTKPNLVEFPILHDGTLFSRNSVSGPDRVVFNRKTKAFCGCMTHTGASGRNKFKLCL